ncbi:hypothetical protein T07_13158, partial [Trichinella nelsoni]
MVLLLLDMAQNMALITGLMERNLGNSATGKCGIAMEPSYPVKIGQNPPNPGPSPPSPIKPPQ